MSADRSASVLARLLNLSRSTGENCNLLLSRFAIERPLYRLSVSPHAGNFVLKGALLFALWCDTPVSLVVAINGLGGLLNRAISVCGLGANFEPAWGSAACE